MKKMAYSVFFTALLDFICDANGINRKTVDLTTEPFIETNSQRGDDLPSSLVTLRDKNIYKVCKDKGILYFGGKRSEEIKAIIEYLLLEEEKIKRSNSAVNVLQFIQEITVPCILTNDAANKMLELLSNFCCDVGRILLISDDGGLILDINGCESINQQHMLGAQKFQDGRFDFRLIAKHLYSACISRKIHREQGRKNAQLAVVDAKENVFMPHCLEVIPCTAQDAERAVPPLLPPASTDFDGSAYDKAADSAELSNEKVQNDVNSVAYCAYDEANEIDWAADCLTNTDYNAQDTSNLQFWDIFNNLDFDHIDQVRALSLINELRTALCNDQGFLLKLQFMQVDVNNLSIGDVFTWTNVLYQCVADINPESAEQFYYQLVCMRVNDVYHWIRRSHDALLKDLDFQIQYSIFQKESFSDQAAALDFLKALATTRKTK